MIKSSKKTNLVKLENHDAVFMERNNPEGIACINITIYNCLGFWWAYWGMRNLLCLYLL